MSKGFPEVSGERVGRKGSSGGIHEWPRKHRDHCGHENRRESSWP